MVGSYWSQLSNMKHHQNIWIRLRETCSPQNIIVKFPGTVIVGGAVQIKNTKVRVYFIKCKFEWFFFLHKLKRHEKDARRALFFALRVCLLELFSSRACCDSLSNQLFGKRDNASCLLFIVFLSICKPKECDDSCFFNIRRFRFFLILVWYEKNGLCFTLHAKLDCRELKPYPGGMLQTTKIILSDVGFFSRVHRQNLIFYKSPQILIFTIDRIRSLKFSDKNFALQAWIAIYLKTWRCTFRKANIQHQLKCICK